MKPFRLKALIKRIGGLDIRELCRAQRICACVLGMVHPSEPFQDIESGARHFHE